MGQVMGRIHFHSDTKRSSLGFFSALDMQLNAAIVDCFYIVCLRTEYGSKERPLIYFNQYGLATEAIKFSNPFDRWGMLRNVSKGVTESVLDRTIFYHAEARKRTAEARSLEQDVVKKKLDNLAAAAKLRTELISNGICEEVATKTIASLLVDQEATIESNSRRGLFRF